jgi:hypothetical protein
MLVHLGLPWILRQKAPSKRRWLFTNSRRHMPGKWNLRPLRFENWKFSQSWCTWCLGRSESWLARCFVLGSEFNSQRVNDGTSTITGFSVSSIFQDCSLNKPSSPSQFAINIHLPRHYFKARAGEVASPNIPRMSYFS